MEETATEVWAEESRVRGAITRCISSLMIPMAETESRAQKVRSASEVVDDGLQGTKAVQNFQKEVEKPEGHATRLGREARERRRPPTEL